MSPPSGPLDPERVATPEHGGSGAHSPTPPNFSRPVSLLPKCTELPDHPWPPAPLAPGVDPKAPKTANRMYSSIVAGMLTESQHRFECHIFVDDAYPDLGTQIQWSFHCWELVCVKSKNFFELTKEMMNLVRDLYITRNY